MMDATFEGSLDGAQAFTAKLSTIENYIGPLMMAWAKVLIEDNRKGVLAGLDKDDQPVQRTSYRRSFTQASYDRPTYVKTVMNPFGGDDWKVNVSGGHEPGYKPGPSHNLTTKQYQAQSGPPLAPRGMASRIISNYTIAPIFASGGHYGVEGGWDDVLNKAGKPFLPAHFEGTGANRGGNSVNWHPMKGVGRGKNLPRRNMSGLRNWGRTRSRKDLRAWIRDIMEQQQSDYFIQAGHNPDFMPSRRFTPRKKKNGP